MERTQSNTSKKKNMTFSGQSREDCVKLILFLDLILLLIFSYNMKKIGPSVKITFEKRILSVQRKKGHNPNSMCTRRGTPPPDPLLNFCMIFGLFYYKQQWKRFHYESSQTEFSIYIEVIEETYTASSCICNTRSPQCEAYILSFNEFISKFEKKYIKAEKKKRIKIFQENVEVMKYYNLMYRYGISSCLMGVNEYSDLTYEEVIGSLTGDISDLTLANETNEGGELRVSESYSSRYIPKDIGEEPKTMDYRDKGAVNPIRNQHKCGSCWAFSAVSTIESQIFLHTGRLVQLSEQNLVDCSKGYAFPNKTGWHGCAGGWKHRAIRYVSKYGIAYRDEYPFTAVEGLCNEDAPKNTYKVMGIQRVMPRSDAELLNALVNRGPIAVSIFVSANFVKYKRGILDDERCNDSKRPNHAMVLVGYGNENGKDYWLIRNSWGESWGEKGYIRLARKVENHCQISLYGFIPVTEGGTLD
ncbi:unnamed protein product, partial [Meganyctiphanes norvegica]